MDEAQVLLWVEAAHSLGAIRHLPASEEEEEEEEEEEVALTGLNALDEAGFTVVSREKLPAA